MSIETLLFTAFFFKASNAVGLISVAVTLAPFFDARIEIIPQPQPNSKNVLFFKESVSENSRSNFVLIVINGGKTDGSTQTDRSLYLYFRGFDKYIALAFFKKGPAIFFKIVLIYSE